MSLERILLVKWRWPDGCAFWSCHDEAELDMPEGQRLAGWQDPKGHDLKPVAAMFVEPREGEDAELLDRIEALRPRLTSDP